MKVHKITVYVIDTDKLGADAVVQEMKNVSYPNDCLSLTIGEVVTKDCGRWHDNHPLNLIDTHEAELKRLFGETP